MNQVFAQLSAKFSKYCTIVVNDGQLAGGTDSEGVL